MNRNQNKVCLLLTRSLCLSTTLLMIAMPLYSSQDLLQAEQGTVLQFHAFKNSLNYLTTYREHTTDILNISDEQGESKTLKRESTDYVEALKETTRLPKDSSFFEMRSKRTLFKNKQSKGSTRKSYPVSISLVHTQRGRLSGLFDMKLLPSFGMPLRFPREPIKEQNSWTSQVNCQDKDLPPLTFTQRYTLKRLHRLNGHPTAEVEYSFDASLKATEISNDPNIQKKVSILQKNNIESVYYEGTGTFTFDYEKGYIVTHLMTMNRRLSKVLIQNQKRTLQELVTTFEFAEALIP